MTMAMLAHVLAQALTLFGGQVAPGPPIVRRFKARRHALLRAFLAPLLSHFLAHLGTFFRWHVAPTLRPGAGQRQGTEQN